MSAVLAVALLASAAQGYDLRSAGGATAPEPPEVAALTCGTGDANRCPRGEELRIAGENLDATSEVMFLGRAGRADNQRAAVAGVSTHEVVVRVPIRAISGKVRAVTVAGEVSNASRRLRIVKPVAPRETTAAPAAPAVAVFPVQGAHEYGTAVNGFGGGRGHQGHDVFAKCGTPVVAAVGGKVTFAKFQANAGNYVVTKADDGTSQVYMHLLAPASVVQGQTVAAGQPIGQVGQSGRASGCHLHFELWTAPGWYAGGSPIDPLPLLKSLER